MNKEQFDKLKNSGEPNSIGLSTGEAIDQLCELVERSNEIVHFAERMVKCNREKLNKINDIIFNSVMVYSHGKELPECMNEIADLM